MFRNAKSDVAQVTYLGQIDDNFHPRNARHTADNEKLQINLTSELHSPTRCHNFTCPYVATPHQWNHCKSFTTPVLHYPIQATRSRTRSSCQDICHNHLLRHRVCLSSVAYEPNKTTNKPAQKHTKKGPCALYFVECFITMPSPLQDYQRWQTGGRCFAELCSQVCSNQGIMQDKIIASHTCFGGHMDFNC